MPVGRYQWNGVAVDMEGGITRESSTLWDVHGHVVCHAPCLRVVEHLLSVFDASGL